MRPLRDPRRTRRLFFVTPVARVIPIVLGALVAVVACGAGDEPEGPYAATFRSVAERAQVPRDLLVAIAEVEGALDLPSARDVAPDAEIRAAGPLQLRRGLYDSLTRAATLVGRSELELRRDSDLALAAGALALAELGGKHGASPDDLASWSAALEEWSGYRDEAHRKDYAHRVFALLARGGTFVGRAGEPITIAPHDLPPTLTIDLRFTLKTLAPAEFGGAEWIPTSCENKCNTSRGATIERIVIHDTEGGWDASVATLQNDPGKSAHYIIGQNGRIGQFIPESYNGWHCGNSHYNRRSIGIEHVGWAHRPFPEALYETSARLVNHLAAKYRIPKDRAHIIGHDQVPNGNRIAQTAPPCAESPRACQATADYGGAASHHDPGVWEWATYMTRLGARAKCNDAPVVLTCSSGGTRAFRCAGGSVEVVDCADRCTPGSTGASICGASADAGAPPRDAAPDANRDVGPDANRDAAPDASSDARAHDTGADHDAADAHANSDDAPSSPEASTPSNEPEAPSPPNGAPDDRSAGPARAGDPNGSPIADEPDATGDVAGESGCHVTGGNVSAPRSRPSALLAFAPLALALLRIGRRHKAGAAYIERRLPPSRK